MTESQQPNPQVEAAIHSLQLRAWSCALTVRIARITGNRETSSKTGSGVLIEFPNRLMVGTAWHVIKEFRRLRETGETVALICDNMPLVSPRLVFRDEDADIAFLDVRRADHSKLLAVPYRPGSLWPPPAVRAEDAVLCVAFQRF